jgi:hypothetical protein
LSCLENVIVGSATAKIAAHTTADFLEGWVGVVPEKSFDSHDLSGRAVATLESIVLKKGLLHRPQLLTLHEAFDGGDFFALGLESQSHAGVAGLALDKHGASAALPPLTTHLGSGQTQLLAQDK